MAAWTFSPIPSTAVVGIASTSMTIATTAIYTVESSNGTVGTSGTTANYTILNSTIPGWLTGRRPVNGQLYPRGVYNK